LKHEFQELEKSLGSKVDAFSKGTCLSPNVALEHKIKTVKE
jgi:hypothetical protein